MELIFCRDCGKELSRSAKRCPLCEARHPGRGNVEHGIHVVGNAVIALCVILCVLSVVFGLILL